VPNLAAGIGLCRRLLEFGGLGHTCAIHSQNRSAILEFGEAMPAFRVVVNSASVHGSIGYSTNLFPAMTLGCGAPGGNITSDNIGPQHLMNVKRIAWETRGVEHRTVPADQRMAGAAISPEPEAVQEKASMPEAPVSAPKAPANSSEAEPEEKKSAAPEPTPAGSPSGVDRAAIARVVETVLAAQGIARGSGAPKFVPAPASAAKEPASPSSIAAEIADRFFGSSANPQTEIAATSPSVSSALTKTAEAPALPISAPNAAKKSEPPAKAAIEIQVFVSENDVRRAMTRSEKIFIGRKTILTPSARDLGLEHEVFVETEAGSIR
jgi:acetaldehyde dehydrogenase (acetylating)